MVRILLVCMGNICRSPLAHSVLQARLAERGWADGLAVDSAGTYAGHAGEPPDPRALAAAHARGYHEISRLRARPVVADDFWRADLILAMDRDNLETLRKRCPVQYRHKLHLFLSWAHKPSVDEVPDPYYGNAAGFERVLELCEQGVEGLLDHLQGTRLDRSLVRKNKGGDQTR